ncbi:hypothetical protein [Helicobacter burdigaliensis]|uniref:hypothetical protein n=1 Tax=Helicobacter burdigaliensis TaxID=2315334 RepID=UPI000EF73AA7|nr:hypothetical protein [Helicobacter burdigaliensis]
MKNFLWFLVLFFMGCEGAKFTLAPSKPQESYVQATRKTELTYENRTQIVLVATHLNAYDIKKYPKEEGEVFLIDVYEGVNAKNNSDEKGFLNNHYSLRLANGDTPLEFKMLKKEELEPIMQENATRWGEYYLVKFPMQNKRDRDRLVLILSHPKYGENLMSFGFKAKLDATR